MFFASEPERSKKSRHKSRVFRERSRQTSPVPVGLAPSTSSQQERQEEIMIARKIGKREFLSMSSALLIAVFCLVFAGTVAAQVKSSSLGVYSPTFVGTAATGCKSGCNLL